MKSLSLQAAIWAGLPELSMTTILLCNTGQASLRTELQARWQQTHGSGHCSGLLMLLGMVPYHVLRVRGGLKGLAVSHRLQHAIHRFAYRGLPRRPVDLSMRCEEEDILQNALHGWQFTSCACCFTASLLLLWLLCLVGTSCIRMSSRV